MPVPDFSPGEVLTAAAMDSIGLWLVKSQTVGTAVASVVVADAFSATYDNYAIFYSGGNKSSDSAITLTLTGLSAGQYYTSFVYGSFSGATVTNEGTSAANLFANAGGGFSGAAVLDATVYAPFIATRNTNISTRTRYASKWGTMSGLHLLNESATGFTMAAASGTMTGGTICVYGFRK
jgi:hypothetical protein